MSSARTYRLGIDLGTTYTAAVVSRRSSPDAPWSEPEIVALGSQSASVASVLYLGGEGTVLVGESAERRGLTEPDRVVRQFKRRIGDDVPLVVGDAVHTAHELAARMGRWVVDKVAEREGGPADAIAVTHPAAWGDHKKDLLASALRAAGVDGVTFLTEPQAAAVAYSARERVEAGGSVAVYDLGGGTFDAAAVRRHPDGFELPGRPEGIEALGGVDFDDRVFDHVREGIGAALEALDFEDPDVLAAVMRLRRECTEAKEALSFDTQTTIPVMLPGIRTNVRLTRVEFEASIRGSIDHTVDALRRTLESAALAPEDLQAVLLVGGSSRIPLVAQMISAELGRPVAVDSDPKTSIAMGAALAIAPRPAAPETPVAAAVPPPPPAPAPTPAAPRPAAPPAPPYATGRAPAEPPTPVAPRYATGPQPSPAPAPAAPAAPAAHAPVAERPRESSAETLDAQALQSRARATAPAPARPPVGTTSPPPRPPLGPAAPQDDPAPDGSRKKIVVIVLVCALLVFALAFGAGILLTLA